MKLNHSIVAIKAAFIVAGMFAASAMANPMAGWLGQPSFGIPLITVDSVKHALNTGATVSAAVDLSRCTRSDGGKSSQTRGGLVVTPYRIQGNGILSFSDTHFTVSTRSGAPEPIKQFLRYTVKPEGDITVSSYIFSVPDYRLTSQVSFQCSINQGVSFHAGY